MTIKDQLRECYETGNDIMIYVDIAEFITLDDIFTIIHLVEHKQCQLLAYLYNPRKAVRGAASPHWDAVFYNFVVVRGATSFSHYF